MATIKLSSVPCCESALTTGRRCSCGCYFFSEALVTSVIGWSKLVASTTLAYGSSMMALLVSPPPSGTAVFDGRSTESVVIQPVVVPHMGTVIASSIRCLPMSSSTRTPRRVSEWWGHSNHLSNSRGPLLLLCFALTLSACMLCPLLVFLQGLDKKETVAKHGKDQVMVWRRSYTTPPPLLPDDRYAHTHEPYAVHHASPSLARIHRQLLRIDFFPCS